ncbi:tryptophan synthase subunit alpha [Maridesulfovibrio hydrothermalis]|uniref:Tryptophan synthase alpha chain n=1 Tax=Maridesulfovibrio hydrothermalis AM13 = DSM 14728 TaxID=1121451 RepID=L0RE35_9BACT|nr:tryptophan synthase subunit alpha [Maridesulfovibrio hydrothermalis]CCO23836.1 Tryptophan synthase alpha chain [Maridesulfovibrio hydrothermalis AM13 = DSM 14728]
MSITKLADKINEAKAQGRTALIPFLPGGYPSRDQFWKEIIELDENGADIIEIGMPFSDPVADGPVVEAASLKCLDDGIGLKWILAGLLENRAGINAGIVLMGYFNPVLQFGLEKFAKEAHAAGVNGLIIADLPFEEGVEFRGILAKYDIALIPLVGLNTSPERMALYAEGGNGFCYYVSVLGTTGDRDSLPGEIKAGLAQAQDVFDIPVALGFGLKHPSQLEALDGLVDAAVFGSALIRHIDAGKSSAEFMKIWK